jgi:hypothetical protein
MAGLFSCSGFAGIGSDCAVDESDTRDKVNEFAAIPKARRDGLANGRIGRETPPGHRQLSLNGRRDFLSNRSGLISLGAIAGLGIGAVAGRTGPVICALAANPRPSHIASNDPADGSAGRERRSGKRVRVLVEMPSGKEGMARSLSGFHGDFERRCHVAISFQR